MALSLRCKKALIEPSQGACDSHFAVRKSSVTVVGRRRTDKHIIIYYNSNMHLPVRTLPGVLALCSSIPSNVSAVATQM